MQGLLEKIPPQNIEAEQSVLGSMLIEKDAIIKAMEILRPDDFYRDTHRAIFKAITDLFDRNEPVDLVTVTEELRQKDALEGIGGVAYITNLANSVPTAANVEYYAKIVAEKSLLRMLINAATRIASMGYEGDGEVEKLLDEAERMIFEISQRKSTQSFVPMKTILMDTFDRIERLYLTKGGITGVPSGFPDLDNLTAGFQPSDLIIIAARPSMGKTSLCLSLALHAAIHAKIPVAIFSLEMSKEQLVQRMLCSEANINAHRLRTGYLEEGDWRRLVLAVGPLSEAPIYIDDSPAITVMEIRAKARRLKKENNLGMIMIDYLQLIQGKGRAENRQQEISEISRSLKALARELNVPVIALSQLSRAVEQRQDKRPMLSDLRESGSLEQDSDVVMFIYREDYYNPETDRKNIADIIIAKQRNGPVDKVELFFMKEWTKFRSIDRKHQAE